MQYEEILPISRLQAAEELESDDWQRISYALLRLALNEPDLSWLQNTIVPYLRYKTPWVRGVAAMCLGHLARIHGDLDTDRCVPEIRRLLADDETRGKAEDALDDIEMFVVS